MDLQEKQDILQNIDTEAVLQADKNLSKQIRHLIAQPSTTPSAQNSLIALLIFSISNLIVPYLLKIPILGWFLEFLMDFFDWGGNMIPSVYMSNLLMTWYINLEQWWIGVTLALLTLLPLGISLLLITKAKKKTGWYWLALIWYALDTIVFLWYTIITLVEMFSSDCSTAVKCFFIIFRFADIMLRGSILDILIKNVTLPKRIKKEWNKTADLMLELFALVNGEEAAKKQTRSTVEFFTNERIKKELQLMLEEEKEKNKSQK